jgi:CheY-like chemotaxis protein
MATPRVLVVDDDAAVRDVVLRLLVRHGYRAVGAANLQEALDALREGDVQALVLDVRLEGAASGLDLLHNIRQRSEFARVPVLVATGGALTESEEATVSEYGAFLFYKPEGYNSMIAFLETLTGPDDAA